MRNLAKFRRFAPFRRLKVGAVFAIMELILISDMRMES